MPFRTYSLSILSTSGLAVIVTLTLKHALMYSLDPTYRTACSPSGAPCAFLPTALCTNCSFCQDRRLSFSSSGFTWLFPPWSSGSDFEATCLRKPLYSATLRLLPTPGSLSHHIFTTLGEKQLGDWPVTATRR